MKCAFVFQFESKEQTGQALSIIDPKYKDFFGDVLSLAELSVEQLNFFLVRYIRSHNYDIFRRLQDSFEKEGEYGYINNYVLYFDLSFDKIYTPRKGEEGEYDLKEEIATNSNKSKIIKKIKSHFSRNEENIPFFLFSFADMSEKLIEDKEKMYLQISGEGVWW